MMDHLRVLIVEDSDSDGETIISHLRKAGYMVEYGRVETAEDMKAALARGEPWDLVIADQGMAGFNSPEALTVLQGTGQDIPFIVVSGSRDDDMAVELMKSGAHDYVTKGNLSRLIPVAEREMREARTRRDRKEAEEMALGLLKDWENIFQAISHPTLILDRDQRILAANRSVMKASGLPEEEILGKKCFEIFHNRVSRGPEECPMEKMIATGEAAVMDMEIEALGGFYLVSCTPVYDEKGDLEKIIHIATDIRDRKKAENELFESRQFLGALMSASPVAVCRVAGRSIIWASDSLSRMTGYAPEELVNVSVRMLYGSDREFEEAGDLLYERGWYEGRMRKKNGSEFPAFLRLAPMDSRTFIVTISDITDIRTMENERNKLQEQLNHAQRMEAIGTLAGGIAHDFNNLLNVIIGYGSLMEMRMKDDDPSTTYLKAIMKAGARATHLTASLLAFSRKQIISPQPTDINEIIQSVEKFLLRVIGEDIELKSFLSPEGMVAMVDTGQIDQVIMNLATNARDAMPDGGKLTITTEFAEMDESFIRTHGSGVSGQYALITFSDTGAGMDEETRRRIFEPFFTTKEPGRGTGLGLAVAYGIIRQHNGYIFVYSEPGMGSTFRIYLPIFKGAVERKAREAVPVTKGGTETILLVEDDEAVRKMIKEVLETAGYTVIEAGDGDTALRLYMEHRERIGFLLLDAIMPRKNGREVYDAIRTLKNDVPALFVSGYTGDIIHKKGILEKGLDFIPKPVSPVRLLLKVREILDRTGPGKSVSQ